MANTKHQEGKQYELEAAYSEEQTPPANFYVGLATDASPAIVSSLTDLTEVTGTGYARQTIASSAAGMVSGIAGTDDWKVTGAEVTFSAGGTWDAANIWFLATTSDNTGKLLASGPIEGAPKTLNNGDTHKVTVVLTQQ